MDVDLKRGDLTTRAAGLLALGVLEATRRLGGAAAAVDRAAGGALARVIASGDFRGRFLEEALVHPPRGRAKRVLMIGLGPREELDAHRVRQAAARAADRARALGAGTLVSAVHGAGAGGIDPERAAQAVAEGSVLGHWKFSAYRTGETPAALGRITLLEHDAERAKRMRPAAARGAAWAEATCVARDLAATPGQDLVPEELARRAREIGRATGAKVRVFGVPELERLGFGALLGVGRGSVHPPRLIVLERAPRTKTPSAPVVVVGKGVTFDTGGLSLKPKENMHKMKYDMSGAAAVLGLFHALETLDLPFPVVGVIPAAENMPGGRALKPGDVLRAVDGTTIEITNTDAEGRLLLADALAWANRAYAPRAMVDLATLTGAVSMALGHLAAGLFTDDEALAAELMAAGRASGETLWRLPLWDAYAQGLASDTADVMNSGPREGGACVAAVFLKRFAKGAPWAHLDIASTAWTPTDRPHEPRGPTGFGVRLLLEWLRALAAGDHARAAGAAPGANQSPARARAKR